MISLDELKRLVARTAVRRVVGTVVALAIGAAISWASPARAQSNGCSSTSCPTLQAAWAECQTWMADPDIARSFKCVHSTPTAQRCGWTSAAVLLCLKDEAGYRNFWGYSQGCPVDKPFDEATGQCGNACTDAPNVAAGASSGSAPICVGGCTYVPDSSAGTTVGYDGPQGNSIFSAGNSWKSNGVTCSAENHPMPWDPQKPTCQTVPGSGGHHCTMPDGTNCVNTAKGRRLCWQPDETGPRMTQDGTEGADRHAPGTPATPPKGMENPQQAGSVTNTTNDNRTTTTVFNGSGNSGGQGNAGQGGNDGSGDGEGDGDEIDFGTPGAGVGTLYEKKGYTEDGVAGEIYSAAMASDIAQGVAHFFSVPSSGACPTFSVPATDFWDSMTFDQHCSGEFAAALAAAGWALLAGIGFLAFRIAFY